jgi:hypothetical protein
MNGGGAALGRFSFGRNGWTTYRQRLRINQRIAGQELAFGMAQHCSSFRRCELHDRERLNRLLKFDFANHVRASLLAKVPDFASPASWLLHKKF